MAPAIVTIAERPELEERLDEIADPWPEFIHHDEVLRENWPRLYEDFRDFQLVLYDGSADAVLGKGCTIPTAWDGRAETLNGGVVEVFEAGGSSRRTCSVRLSPLSIRVSRGERSAA